MQALGLVRISNKQNFVEISFKKISEGEIMGLGPHLKEGSRLICLLLTLLLHFIFYYLLRCILPDFPFVSSLVSLPFLICCHRTTITFFICYLSRCTLPDFPFVSSLASLSLYLVVMKQ